MKWGGKINAAGFLTKAAIVRKEQKGNKSFIQRCTINYFIGAVHRYLSSISQYIDSKKTAVLPRTAVFLNCLTAGIPALAGRNWPYQKPPAPLLLHKAAQHCGVGLMVSVATYGGYFAIHAVVCFVVVKQGVADAHHHYVPLDIGQDRVIGVKLFEGHGVRWALGLGNYVSFPRK